MGANAIPTEAAPAYEDLFAGHERPGNMSSGYASIPQNDVLSDQTPILNEENNEFDIEQQQHQPDDVHLHHHQHQHTDGAEGADEEGGHMHCAACDRLLERKERRMDQRHCCNMVAVTFMVGFLCLMLLGLGIVAKKH